MDFKFSKEAQRLFEEAALFAERNLAGRAVSGFDTTGWRLLADFGAFRQASARQATSGLGAIETAAMLEGLGRGGADRGLLFAAGAHLFGCLTPLVRYGTQAQIEAWEPSLRDGTAIGALAVTEADGRSASPTFAAVSRRPQGP